MKQILISQKGIIIAEVPEPTITENNIVVKNMFSCVSVGTEINGLKDMKKSLLSKLIEKPQVISKVYESIKKSGVMNTKDLVGKKLKQVYELGYSSSGIVEEVGSRIKHIRVGDYVACSGGGYATHSEKIVVPENLVSKIKNEKKLLASSTVSLGAIALQGVRRACPTIGECFLVVGLGLIGQITIQILRNNGIEVYGIEPNDDFRNIAKKNNFKNIYKDFQEMSANIDDDILKTFFDSVIITAASSSNNIISSCFKFCRKKGRVVLVGDIGLNLKREDIYKKEIDFLISSSYGPGRYDEKYEKEGSDYPLPYVRWTMNRNMKFYIDMIDKNLINLDDLTKNISSFNLAESAYNKLLKKPRPISLFFRYSTGRKKKKTFIESNLKNKKVNSINCSVIGAGSFASEVLIPNLVKMKDLCVLDSICTKTSVSSYNISKNFNIPKYSSRYQDILKDKKIDTVFISTRHNLHSKISLDALNENKHVFVEKPLCLNKKELLNIQSFYNNKKKNRPILVTGFNRRFSPFIEKIKSFVKECHSPIKIEYSVNAEKIDHDSWNYSEEGGGRNIGEACHFYDLILYLMNDDVVKVNVSSIKYSDILYHKTDNFFVTIKFKNGSLAQINYTVSESRALPKEIIEINFNGNSLILNDFRKLSFFSNFNEKIIHESKKSEKGHFECIQSFLRNTKNGVFSIPLKDQIKTMDLTFQVEDLI